MIHSYKKIKLQNPKTIQCSSCLKVLGLSEYKQEQSIYCLDCINHGKEKNFAKTKDKGDEE